MPAPFFIPDITAVYSAILSGLQANPFLAGISVVFGEENRFTAASKLPQIVFYPSKISYQQWTPGYVQNLDPSIKVIWQRSENLVFELWDQAASNTATAAQDADRIYLLSQKLSSALYYQRPNGYQFSITSGGWALFEGAKTRRGRAQILNITFDIPVFYTPPTEALITSVSETVDIITG